MQVHPHRRGHIPEVLPAAFDGSYNIHWRNRFAGRMEF